MAFATALDAASQLLVLGFLVRDSLDAVELTGRYLCDFVGCSTSLPLRRLECLQIEGNDPGDEPLLRDSYCVEIDITKAELSKEFIDQLVTLRGRFKASSLLMRPVHFVDVAPADLQRLVACLCPGLSHFQCTSGNITPAHVTDQLLDSLTSNGVNSAFFRSLDTAVYFDVSDEAILRFCFGTFEAKRDLRIENFRVTQPFFDRLIQAHRDSSNPMQLCLDDPKMPEIDGSGHADCIVTRDAQKTTYKFATSGWTTYVSVRLGHLCCSM